MKKLFSKRSGFTLVEIIVAFAIFAIMAAIIVQMMGLVVVQRQNNKDYSDQLSDQQKNLVSKSREHEAINDSNKSGDLVINLKDEDGNDVVDIEMPYEMRAADGTQGSADGINYFLADVDYDSAGTGSSGGGGSGGGTSSGSQTSRLDTRITGTKGFKQITFREVTKDTNTDGLEPGQTRYLFQVSAWADTAFADEDIAYAQYRLYFYDPVKLDAAASSIEYTDDNGRKYTKLVYSPMTIVEVGYSDDNNTEYTVEKMGTNSVRIGTPFTGSGVKFEYYKFSKFYIIFDGDPQLTVESFGDNCVDGDVTGDGVYKHEDVIGDSGDTISPNIYGAFQYERNYVG